MSTLRGPWGALSTETYSCDVWCDDCGPLAVMLGLDPRHRHIWTLNGEPITVERAEEIIAAARARVAPESVRPPGAVPGTGENEPPT